MMNSPYFADRLPRFIRRSTLTGDAATTSHPHRPARRVALDIRRHADRHLSGW